METPHLRLPTWASIGSSTRATLDHSAGGGYSTFSAWGVKAYSIGFFWDTRGVCGELLALVGKSVDATLQGISHDRDLQNLLTNAWVTTTRQHFW